MNNFSTALTEEPCSWRHNSVLNKLAHCLIASENFRFQLYAELDDYETTGMFFNSSKLDIVLIKNNT